MPRGKTAHTCEHGLAIKDCPPCKAARQKAWYEKYCEKRGGKEVVNAKRAERYVMAKGDDVFMDAERKRGREFWQRERHAAIMAYGGYVCACCGETEPLFLQIDHINNDGANHRRSLGYGGNGKGAHSAMLMWMRRNDYPEGFQVLCANCNHGKSRNGGVCPHCNRKPTVA